MLLYDLGGQWEAWVDEQVADKFYRPDWQAQPDYVLPVPGHWQCRPELAKHQGSVFYRTTFQWQPSYASPVVRLRIGGGFYLTTVWLNGHLLAEHDGYFEPLVLEINEKHLQAGKNLLAVRVDCPPPGKTWRDIIVGIYGEWDCKPDVVNPGGLWGDIVLQETCGGFWRAVKVKSRLTAWNSAQISLQTALAWRTVAAQVRAQVTIAPRNFMGKAVVQDFELEAEPGDQQLEFNLTLHEPKLWWTWDLGRPHLYDVVLDLYNEQGHKVDSFTSILGVRDIAWNNWQFSLNGRRLFLRGINYGPASFYPAALTAADLERDIDLLVDANFNIVRVHNHIAPPEFYRLCAEKGLAVWQDFPLDKRYGRNITGVALRQIRAMVQQLHNEPALCFWSCHNEPYALPKSQQEKRVHANVLNTTARSAQPTWNKDILDPRLREAVLHLDQSRPVFAHSGVFGFIRGGSATHHYFGWNTQDYTTAAKISRVFPRTIRLVSEYGAQSWPLDQRILEEAAQTGIWPDLNWEQIAAKYLADTKLLHNHVDPHDYANLPSYARATQAYQAELLQFYHEYLRRHRFRPCGGAMAFYFADAVPLVSWSLLDHRRRPKLAYAATQRAMEPLQVFLNWPRRLYFGGERWRSPVYIVNDMHRNFMAIGLSWQLKQADGTVLQAERGIVDAPADSIHQEGWLELSIPEGISGSLQLELVLTMPNHHRIYNSYVIRVVDGD